MIKCNPEVKIIADSVNQLGERITTFQLKYWRAIHAEVMTHRAFSRNARSSRATPIDVNIKQVMTEPWGPRFWGKNQAGMSAYTPLEGEELNNAKFVWEQSARNAATLAMALKACGCHKQIANRILEPYMPIDVVLTATDFKNFFELRMEPEKPVDKKTAQPEIYDLAKAMYDALQTSKSEKLKEYAWHLPYITDEDWKNCKQYDDLPLISAARCARVSYKAYDGTTSIRKDLELAKKLQENKHWSAFEHTAMARADSDHNYANFHGWRSLRHMLEG